MRTRMDAWKPAAALALALLIPACAGGGGNAPDAAAAAAEAAAAAALDRHLATEEIAQLKARYFRCLDTKDWACLETLFTPDAQAVYDTEGSGDLGTPDNPVTGPAAIAAFIRQGVEHLVTVHHGHMPEIQITSPTTASGIWAMEDILRTPGGDDVLQGWGHYHETYERIDGRWLIRTLRLTRLRVDRS